MAESLDGLRAPADSDRSAGPEANAELSSQHPSNPDQQTIPVALVDMPGLGAVPVGGSGLPEPLHSMIDELPPEEAELRRYLSVTGRDEVRERALLRLIYGAHWLANSRIDTQKVTERCAECQAFAVHGFGLAHALTCRTGNVMQALDEIWKGAREGGAR